MATATLLLSCPDQKGLVATMAEWVYRHDGNIVHADQHTDASESVFFQRVEFELDGFDLDRAEIVPALSPLLERFAMRCDRALLGRAPDASPSSSRSRRTACTTCSPGGGCGELDAEIPLVISNHPDHADVAAHFDVEFAHLPVTPEYADRAGERDVGVARRARHRSRRARPLHADLVGGVRGEVPEPDHQHPPLVPARVRRRHARTTRPTTAA